MKPGGSTLNPHAAAYVPISKRELEPENHSKSFLQGDSEQESEKHDQVIHSTTSQFSSLCSYGGPLQTIKEVAGEQTTDEQFNEPLYLLKMMFPEFSEESIADAYLLNEGDFEATVYMLHHLESHGDESSETLPDTLGIGDVSEYALLAHYATQKPKNIPVASESSSDSAGSSQAVD